VGTRYRWDDFVLDLDAYRVERAGVPLSLEPKAFNLLALMIQRPGHVFSKQELFDAVWPDTAVTDHALTRVVAQLRRVLGDDVRAARYLETVPTRGYRWLPAVETLAERSVTAAAGSAGLDVPAAVESPLAKTLSGPAPAATFRARMPAGQSEPSPVSAFRTRPLPVRRRAFAALASALALGSAILILLLWTGRSTRTAATEGASRGGSPAYPAPKTDGGPLWPVQLTTHAGLDVQPALSPQGDAIAFVSDRSGAFEIYVRALGGTGGEVRLTSDGGQNMQPAWSRDGKFLAYHSDRLGGIWVVAARGGTPRQVAAVGSSPAWSPDGLRIAFQSDEDTDVAPNGYGAQTGSTLWIAGADGQGGREITHTGRPMGGHAFPVWSPDGRRLAFSVFDGGRDNGIWMLDIETLEPAPVERGTSLYESVFAPDNSALYVASGEAMILKIPLDPATGARRGTHEEIPIGGVPGVRGMTISADGRRVGFAGTAMRSEIWAQPITPDGLAAGRAVALTSDTSRRNSLPSISPDGSKVAYMSLRRGQLPNVWIMDADGRNGLQVTSDETAEHLPKWFPDGKRVAYSSTRGTVSGIWAVDISTRREELFFDMTAAQRGAMASVRLKGKLGELDLSPSMTRAAFSLMAPPIGRRVLYVTGTEPFSPRRLTPDTESIGYPAWSRDERSVAVEIKDGSSTQAGVVDVESGAVRRLTGERGQTWVRSWSPDGRKVAAAMRRGGRWSLDWIDVRGGRQGVITPEVPPGVFVRYPVWSPRGDRVVFERGEMHGNIWMLALR
jgi:Tol biopolymer transport system component/DNA-binding winged helix-turn-helix (wHTH) protein